MVRDTNLDSDDKVLHLGLCFYAQGSIADSTEGEGISLPGAHQTSFIPNKEQPTPLVLPPLPVHEAGPSSDVLAEEIKQRSFIENKAIEWYLMAVINLQNNHNYF